MKYYILFTIALTFISLLAGAEEQILFVSRRHGNDEIYRQFPAGRTQRLTFDEGGDYYPALSPDGRKMAHASIIDGNIEIVVMELKSGKRQQLTLSPKHDSHPTWSPDGRRIAFASDRDGDMEIYVMDAKGKNVKKLTDNFPWDDSWPHWSPVSQKVVFTSNRDGGADQVYLLDVQTSNQRKLTTSSFHAYYPKWSPNGSQIAYLSEDWIGLPPLPPAIWRVKPDGSDLDALVTEGKSNTHPEFSRDGKWIAFNSRRDFNTDIYALNLETQELKRLTTHLGYDMHPDWSPDGERIAFVSTRDGNPDIFTMTVNREQLTNLTKNGMAEHHPTWSPDGEKIAFSRVMGDNSTRIYVMDSDGKNEVQLIDLHFNSDFPAWSPRGDIIAFVNRPERGNPESRICTVDFDGKNLQVLYENQNEPIEEIAWSAEGTQIIFSAIDGRIAFFDTVTHEVLTINVPVGNLYTLDWSSNGQEIIFSGLQRIFQPPRHGVFIVDRDGNHVRTIMMEAPQLTVDGLAWSPDGNKMLLGHDGGLYTLDLNSEAIELFIEFASYPDWQNPSRPRSVSPRNKLNTTWGEMKTDEKR